MARKEGKPARGAVSKRPAAHQLVIAALVWVAVWSIASRELGLSYLLPDPLHVAATLALLVRTPEFWAAVAGSLMRVFGGLAAGMALGTLAAAAAARSSWVRALASPLVGAVKAAPVASFVILVLLWVRSEGLALAISFLMAFPIVYTNVLEGVDATDPQLIEMADVFGVRGLDRVRTIYAAQVMPYLTSAASLASGFCWKAGIAAEVIGLPDGSIGAHLYDAKVYLDTPSLFAWTIAVVLLSLVLDWLLKGLFARVQRRWEVRP